MNVMNYGSMRDFLRYFFIYGCYSREDIEEVSSFSVRKYDEELMRLRRLFGEKYMKETIKDRKKYIKLSYSYYNIIENYLAETYLIRNYTSLGLSVFFHIYFNLWEKEKLTLNQLIEIIEREISVEKDLTSTIRRIAEEMVNKGIINRERVGYRVYYKKNIDVFYGLKDDELKELYIAVSFFSQIYHPLSVGKYLKDSIYRYIRYYRKIDLEHEKEIFLFKYSKFQKIIDEEVVCKLEQIIDRKKKVLIKYNNEKILYKDIIGVPIKLIWDNNYGIWYLELFVNDNIIKLELEDIIEVEELDDIISEKDLNSIKEIEEVDKKKLKEVKVLFEVENFNKRNFLLSKIRRGIWGGEVEILDKHSFIYKTNLNNWEMLKPWLLSFGHRAKVIDSPEHNLYNELKSEWFEMGELYGIVCGTEK